MELQTAKEIIATLARGVHPVTGECMPPDSPYNEPPVIRALFTVSQALEDEAPRKERAAAPNSGKPWAPEEDARLDEAFMAGTPVKQLALDLGRSRFAVESRLVRMGKLPPRVGMRMAASANAPAYSS